MDEHASQPIEILLVEDNPADVRLIREAMQEAKVQNKLNVVADGETAGDYLRGRGRPAKTAPPDLILLDLNLPKKKGHELLREIKMDDRLRRIPVIVLTSSQAEQDIINCYNLHLNAYVTKPIDFDHFIAVVQSINKFWLEIAKLPTDDHND